MLTGVMELCKGILFHFLRAAVPIFKYRAPVCVKHGRDTIGCQNLIEYVVIAFEGFLVIKVSADDLSGRIIDSDMEIGFLLSKP